MRIKSILLYLIILFSFSFCKSKKNEAENFTTPKLPVIYDLDSSYHKINSTDTALNLDDTTKKIVFKTDLMNKDSIKLYGLDTLKFHHPFYYTGSEHNVEWFFGGIGYSTTYANGKLRKEKTKAFVDVSSKVNIATYKKREKDQVFESTGIYHVGIYADIIAASKINDSVLFAIGHPILKQARVTEDYVKIDERDSVLEKTYFDKIDSAKMIYIKFIFAKK